MINIDLSGLGRALGNWLSGGVKKRPVAGESISTPYGSVPTFAGTEAYVPRPIWADLFGGDANQKAWQTNYYNMMQDKELANRLAIEKAMQELSIGKEKVGADIDVEKEKKLTPVLTERATGMSGVRQGEYAANRAVDQMYNKENALAGYASSLGLAPSDTERALAISRGRFPRLITEENAANTLADLNAQQVGIRADAFNPRSFRDQMIAEQDLAVMTPQYNRELLPYQHEANLATAGGAKAVGEFTSKYPHTFMTQYGGQAGGVSSTGEPITFNEIYDKPFAPKEPDNMSIVMRAEALKRLYPNMSIGERFVLAQEQLRSQMGNQTPGLSSPSYREITNPETGQTFRVPAKQ